MNRIRWIDNAKGIAILLIIIGHTSTKLSGFWNFQFVYGIHLVVFFLLSGYNFKKKTLTEEWINSKFKRLMVPYFYTCIAILFTDIINSILIHNDSSIISITNIIYRDLLRGFFGSGTYKVFGTIDLGTRIGAIWFLPALFFATLCFQYLLSIISDDKKLGIISSAIALFGYISARFIWFPFSIQSAMMAVPFLWIGYEIKKHNILNNITWRHYILAQIILLLGIYYNYCGISFARANINDILISIPVGLSGCLLIYLISVIFHKGIILSYIGQISLTILCTHLYALETMNFYFNSILDWLHLSGNTRIWCYILVEITFAIGVALIIEFLKKKISLKNRIEEIETPRDKSVDIAKGIFIILMIIGHLKIDASFRTFIYSCHMISFVLFSGYFFKANRSPALTIKRMGGAFLVPYLIFVIGTVLLAHNKWNLTYFKDIFIQYTLGMSFSKKLFSHIPSVGPVYFILMLFIIRLLYVELSHYLKSDLNKWAIIICISILGMLLGNKGYWLPWSIDIALYAMIYYQIGVCFQRYNILKRAANLPFFYFILTPIWVYMIYIGGMEIATRNYGQYGLTIIGSVSGVLIIYMLSSYIEKHLSFIAKPLSMVGEASVIIIIIHTMIRGQIERILALQFSRSNISFMILQILSQLILAIIVKQILSLRKKVLREKICK